MNKKNSNFNQYGHSFQSKLVASLLKDRPFLEQIQDILEPNYFESQANKWLVEQIKKYFVQYKKLPTLEALKIIIGISPNLIGKLMIYDGMNHKMEKIQL